MIRVEAPAKLNLYLHVTGRRADGYHELDSLVTFTALADTLEIASADALSLTVSGPFAEALGTGDNLATRAAAALAERLGRRACVRIVLQKRIPVAAGLGGGSADAAAVLRGLARLWGLGAAHASDLQDVALGLGADVPVCLDSRAAYMAGIGESVERAAAAAALRRAPGQSRRSGAHRGDLRRKAGAVLGRQSLPRDPFGCIGTRRSAAHPAQRSGTAGSCPGSRNRPGA